MLRPKLEVSDIFRLHGEAWRAANSGHVSLAQRRVMTAIETCRTAKLGGHIERCEDCAHTRVAYNSCRNRHCPKCQGTAAKQWLAEREADLLPVPYYHVVFTLPAPISDIAYQNKAAIYDILFKAAAETLTTIAADPKHLGARIGLTSVLHTWGSALTHHPHVHIIVPGGGIALDGEVGCRAGPASSSPCACSRACSADCSWRSSWRRTRAAFLTPLHRIEWVVYSKRPLGGPQAVLAYLSRYTHRVAISNSRLIAFDGAGVTFKYKDYRTEGPARHKIMTLDTGEFIRRFLIHVLPSRFHRIRHYGLFAKSACADNIARARELLAVAKSEGQPAAATVDLNKPSCPCCGGRMIVIETFQRGASPRTRPTAAPAVIRIDTS